MITRNKIFEALGAKPTNPRWSWCAMASDYSLAVFTIWEDHIHANRYELFRPDSSPRKRAGATDQKRILDCVLENGIPSYGLRCVAKNVNASPRSIKEIDDRYLLSLQIIKDGLVIYANLGEKALFVDLVRTSRQKNNSISGLKDLDFSSQENDVPDRARVVHWVVERNPNVRKFVITQAKGCCEYCGKKGFRLQNGDYYLEAHHIISLANQGRDTKENVIALCPEHHREAHYGVRAEELEGEFLKCIQKRNFKGILSA